MKNFLIILLALIIGGGGGYFAWKYLAGRGGEQPRSEAITTENYREPFMWGVNVNPSAVGNYNEDTWATQMAFVKNLGAQWIRLSFDNEPSNKFAIFDDMISYAQGQGIKVYLGLGSTKPILTIDDTYKDGYQVGHEIAIHYKGKIQYYQLMSEQGSTALKGSSYSGESESDYDLEKYTKVREWMKGASAAIRKVDPNAYLVITDQWTHYAYIQMLLRDKVDFDIIGWNWFGDMGMMGERKLTDGTLLIDKLKSFNKPIILSEVNYRPGKNGMDEAKQSDFIKKMADWAYNSNVIKGFIVHELVDLAPVGSRKADYYGLIKFKTSQSGGYKFGDAKQAFLTYKEIISRYSR